MNLKICLIFGLVVISNLSAAIDWDELYEVCEVVDEIQRKIDLLKFVSNVEKELIGLADESQLLGAELASMYLNPYHVAKGFTDWIETKRRIKQAVADAVGSPMDCTTHMKEFKTSVGHIVDRIKRNAFRNILLQLRPLSKEMQKEYRETVSAGLLAILATSDVATACAMRYLKNTDNVFNTKTFHNTKIWSVFENNESNKSTIITLDEIHKMDQKKLIAVFDAARDSYEPGSTCQTIQKDIWNKCLNPEYIPHTIEKLFELEMDFLQHARITTEAVDPIMYRFNRYAEDIVEKGQHESDHAKSLLIEYVKNKKFDMSQCEELITIMRGRRNQIYTLQIELKVFLRLRSPTFAFHTDESYLLSCFRREYEKMFIEQLELILCQGQLLSTIKLKIALFLKAAENKFNENVAKNGKSALIAFIDDLNEFGHQEVIRVRSEHANVYVTPEKFKSAHAFCTKLREANKLPSVHKVL